MTNKRRRGNNGKNKEVLMRYVKEEEKKKDQRKYGIFNLLQKTTKKETQIKRARD